MKGLHLTREQADKWNELLSAMRCLSQDPHYPSMRPCKTCKAITMIIDEPFGCYFYQARRKESNSP